MNAATSLIPGLDEIVRHGDPKRRDDAARRIAELFLEGGEIPATTSSCSIASSPVSFAHRDRRACRSGRTASIRQCAARAGRTTRADDEISIAGQLLPVARHRRAGAGWARIKGQGHLLAMSGGGCFRPISPTSSCTRRSRGQGARRRQCRALLHDGYSSLIRRAGQDAVLTLMVGQRADLSGPQLEDLLAGSIDVTAAACSKWRGRPPGRTSGR
jgi:hypothetical protein